MPSPISASPAPAQPSAAIPAVQRQRRVMERTGRISPGGSRARPTSCRSASISRTPISPASSITPTICKFCERGRTDFIRLLGIDAKRLANPEQGEPAVFVVRRIEIDYLKPGRLDDVLEVVTRCAEIGGARADARPGGPPGRDAACARQGRRRAGHDDRQTAADSAALIRDALERFVNQCAQA